MKPRIPEVVHLPVTFHAMKDHVVAVFKIDSPVVGVSTFGVRFESPEQLLEFFSQMMEKAVKVWPDNEWIQEYLS
jgi:hypothetical protein